MRSLVAPCLAILLGVTAASGVPFPDVAPLLLQVKRGEVRSSMNPTRTVFHASGRLYYTPSMAGQAFTFSPGTRDAAVDLSSPQGTILHEGIPAGDPGWKGTGRKLRWKSAPGVSPAMHFEMDLARGTFSCSGIGTNEADLSSALLTLTVTLGGDIGLDQHAWQSHGSDRLTFRFPHLNLAAREQLAIERLRAIGYAQATAKLDAIIDTDNDLQGEFGTLSELSGATGIRTGYLPGVPACSDFGTSTLPTTPLLPAEFTDLIENGFVAADGYAFMVFLPDGSVPAGFTHEAGLASTPYLFGGSQCIGIDASESTWCAYAQPLRYGRTGRRRFFVNQTGVVLESSNSHAKGAGTVFPIQGNSAFLGSGITSAVAVGTLGNDTDLWKAVE